MMRNDYRRALILLRCNEAGWSGHVRLERRTLMGSMYFATQSPREGGEIYALLAGRGREDYYACVLGRLTRDDRGQAVLSHNFDPRNLCGRELEQYQLIVVADNSDGDCRVVLYGNVDGHTELNWERVRQAVCLSLQPVQENPCRPTPREEAAGTVLPEAAAQEDRGALDTLAPEMEPEGIERLEAMPVQAAASAEEVNATPENDVEGAETEQTAAALLGADLSLPWPEEIGELKALFAQQPPLADGPGNGYVYIAAPLPEDSPYDFLAVGLREEGGIPVAVSYALPAAYTAQPPAGLEAYRWLGDGNRGWWVSEIDLKTGGQI